MRHILILVIIVIVIYVYELKTKKHESLYEEQKPTNKIINEIDELYIYANEHKEYASINYEYMIKLLNDAKNSINSLKFTHNVDEHKMIDEKIHNLEKMYLPKIKEIFDIAQKYNKTNIGTRTKLIYPESYPKAINYYDMYLTF